MNARVALIAVGTELLRHGRTDTNGEELSGLLEAGGFHVSSRAIVPDETAAIAGAARAASSGSHLVILTGGIGPTLDDLTREAVSEAFGVALRVDPETLVRLDALSRRRGIPLSKAAARQALIPDGARILPNPIGTAPGFLLHLPGDRLVASLPGVPSEMRRMMREELLPRVGRMIAGEEWQGVRPRGTITGCLKISGLTEARLQDLIEPLFRDDPGADLTILSEPGECTFLVRGRGGPPGEQGEDPVSGILSRARALLGDHVFAEEPAAHLEEAMGRLLEARGESIATAESCTGGLLGSLITSVPGATGWYRGGWIVYADEAKRQSLEVPPELLKTHGAVSEAVAVAMAASARRLADADWAIAITGIAGPAGGSADKPVGTVWCTIEGEDVHEARQFHFGGDRQTIRLLSARCALDMVRRRLAGAG